MSVTITQRDTDAINFVDRFGIASMSQIATAIYSGSKQSERIARRRLRILAESKLLSRMRLGQCAEYVYYSGKTPPVRVQHHLLLVSAYNALLTLGGHIEKWEREPDWGTLRPDAYCLYLYNGRKLHIAVEVETNSNPFNQFKYEQDFKQQKNAQNPRFKAYPKVLIISDRRLKIEPSEVSYLVIPQSILGIDKLLKG